MSPSGRDVATFDTERLDNNDVHDVRVVRDGRQVREIIMTGEVIGHDR